jgi:hypothetical protein
MEGQSCKSQLFSWMTGNPEVIPVGRNKLGFDDFLWKSLSKEPNPLKTKEWRRGWDLNPRARFCQATRFRGGLFQPLRHLSGSRDVKRLPEQRQGNNVAANR